MLIAWPLFEVSYSWLDPAVSSPSSRLRKSIAVTSTKMHPISLLLFSVFSFTFLISTLSIPPSGSLSGNPPLKQRTDDISVDDLYSAALMMIDELSKLGYNDASCTLVGGTAMILIFPTYDRRTAVRTMASFHKTTRSCPFPERC